MPPPACALVALTSWSSADCGTARVRVPLDVLHALGPEAALGSAVRVTITSEGGNDTGGRQYAGEWRYLCKLTAWPVQQQQQHVLQQQPHVVVDPLVELPGGSATARLVELIGRGQAPVAFVRVRLAIVRGKLHTPETLKVHVPSRLSSSPTIPLLLQQCFVQQGCRIILEAGAVCCISEVAPPPPPDRPVCRVTALAAVTVHEATAAAEDTSAAERGSDPPMGTADEAASSQPPSSRVGTYVAASDGHGAPPDAAASTMSALSSGMAALSIAKPGRASASEKLAGMEHVLDALRELIGWPTQYAAIAAALGVRWPRGVLLHGPPGSGKTACVMAVAEECGAELHNVTASSIFGAFQGESERRLREAFAAASASARKGNTVVLLLDEIDALAPRRTKGRAHEGRVVAQLLTLLDGAAPDRSKGASGHLLVVGTSNRPNSLDPAMRRPGRLDRELLLGMPSEAQRTEIMELQTRRMPLAVDVRMAALAKLCHGYTGADIAALCREAAMTALSSGDTLSGEAPAVRMADFMEARRKVKPSVTRGAEVDVGQVSWDDIGGLGSVKERLQQAVEWPLLHAEAFKRLGLSAPRGVLLHGPPGCCKTTLARAAASSSKATLIPLSGAQLYSMYVGEGESILRDTFKRARQAAPSIVFLDEIDSVAGKRSEGDAGAVEAGGTGVRLLSALLTEMDGLEQANGVLVMGATNRPAALDAALCRPGRFDVVLFVPPPDEAGREQALRIHTRGMPLHEDVDLAALAQRCDLFTGAELSSVCREAALAALREDMEGAQTIKAEHFQAALAMVRPTLTASTLSEFSAWRPGNSR